MRSRPTELLREIGANEYRRDEAPDAGAAKAGLPPYTGGELQGICAGSGQHPPVLPGRRFPVPFGRWTVLHFFMTRSKTITDGRPADAEAGSEVLV